MLESYNKICALVKKMDGIDGRKRFHKLIYLSKEKGIPFEEDFEWNLYGPFSRELASEIDSAEEMNLLEESISDAEYQYKLTENGNKLLEKFQAFSPEENKMLDDFLTKIKDFNSKDLELIASINYLQNEGYDDDYLIKFLKYAKKYTTKEIEGGKHLLDDIYK